MTSEPIDSRRYGVARSMIDENVVRILGLLTFSALVVSLTSGLRVDIVGFLAIPAAALLFLPALLVMRRAGVNAAGAAFVQLLTALSLNVPILILSYAVMRAGLPLVDARLAEADAMLGFSPHGLISLVGGSSLLERAFAIAYASFGLQVLLVASLLTLSGDRRRGDQFLVAYGATTMLCICISIAFPAVGTMTHYKLDVGVTGFIETALGVGFLESFDGVRGDPAFELKPGAAAGIVTFPSIHASTALLCAWAMGSRPRLRWPFLALNLLMFLSAVTHGAHYLIDVLAGGGVALAVVAAMRWSPVRVTVAGLPTAGRSPGVPA